MQQCSRSDYLEACARCLIGLGAALLPIAKRTDRDVKTSSKVFLVVAKRIEPIVSLDTMLQGCLIRVCRRAHDSSAYSERRRKTYAECRERGIASGTAQ